MSDNLELLLVVKQEGEDSEAATQGLRSELQRLAIDQVSLAPTGPLPSGAKAVDPVTLGALAVSLAPVVIPPLIELLKSWMARKEGRSVVIRKKVGDVSTEIEIKSPLSDESLAALVKQLSRGK